MESSFTNKENKFDYKPTIESGIKVLAQIIALDWNKTKEAVNVANSYVDSFLSEISPENFKFIDSLLTFYNDEVNRLGVKFIRKIVKNSYETESRIVEFRFDVERFMNGSSCEGFGKPVARLVYKYKENMIATAKIGDSLMNVDDLMSLLKDFVL